MDVILQLNGLKEVQAELAFLEKQSPKGIERAMFRIGGVIRRTAKSYAPIAPGVGVINRARKLSGRKPIKRRSDRATSGPGRNIGGLIKSITAKVWRPNKDYIGSRLYVPAGSEAGRYAYIIEHNRGVTWFNRGLGTIARGPQAREKFMYRAIKDNLSAILRIIKGEYRKAVGVDLSGR